MHLGAGSRLLSIAVVPFAFSVAAFGATSGGAGARASHAVRPPDARATRGPLSALHGRTVRGWLNVPAGSHEPPLYVAKDGGVAIYSGRGREPQQVGALSQSGVDAYGVYVDRHGTAYVVNWTGSPPGVSVYPPGATQPSLFISAQLQRPLFAIVDHTGRLYVSDGDTGQIVVYRRGRTEPERILSTNGFEADGMAFDAQGNLFVAYRSSGHDGIDEFPGGQAPAQDLGISLRDPQGLVIDRAGALVVAETRGSDSVDVFPPGQTQPSQRWHVRQVPTGLAFGLRSQSLFISCLAGTLKHIPYPGGTKAKRWLKTTGAVFQGMAFSPVAHF